MAEDPFFLSLQDLHVVRRHLLERLEAAQMHFLHEGLSKSDTGNVGFDLPKDRPSDVVGHVATADDDDSLSQGHRVAEGHVS